MQHGADGSGATWSVISAAAQIGWLETCIPVGTAQAITNIELDLSTGVSKEAIHHQLRVFEAYELGLLLATWETTNAIICLPRIGGHGGPNGG